MVKTLVTLLAVIGFASASVAQMRAKPKVEKVEAEKRAKQIHEMKPEEIARENSRKGNTAARVAEQTRELSKISLEVEELNLIKNQSTRNEIDSLIKNYDDKVNNDNNFLARVSVSLIKEVKSNPDVKAQDQLLKFIDESFELMKLGGESGVAARKAMAKLSGELSRGTNLDNAIYAAMKEAFPKLTEAQLKEKIEEFKRNCMGQA